MTYTQQRYVAIGVLVCLGMMGGISLGNAETLGLTPRIVAWLAILTTGLGVLQGFLPDVRGSAQQVPHIANRIMELSPADRLALEDEVNRRHAAIAAEQQAHPPG